MATANGGSRATLPMATMPEGQGGGAPFAKTVISANSRPTALGQVNPSRRPPDGCTVVFIGATNVIGGSSGWVSSGRRIKAGVSVPSSPKSCRCISAGQWRHCEPDEVAVFSQLRTSAIPPSRLRHQSAQLLKMKSVCR